jgi:hypothetical protein
MTASRGTNVYDLMYSAYNAPDIFEHGRALGHVPIIDANPRGMAKKRLKQKSAMEKCQLRISRRDPL